MDRWLAMVALGGYILLPTPSQWRGGFVVSQQFSSQAAVCLRFHQSVLHTSCMWNKFLNDMFGSGDWFLGFFRWCCLYFGDSFWAFVFYIYLAARRLCGCRGCEGPYEEAAKPNGYFISWENWSVFWRNNLSWGFFWSSFSVEFTRPHFYWDLSRRRREKSQQRLGEWSYSIICSPFLIAPWGYAIEWKKETDYGFF